MTATDCLKKVQDFIYSKEVHADLEKINNHLMNINVFEISGMGNQEIKHSNVLAWMFGDNEHRLGYQMLEKFLAKVTAIDNHNRGEIDTDKDKTVAKLRQYAHFTHSEKIKVEREYTLFFDDRDKKKQKCIVDLLLVDEDKQTVIAIENKVWSGEGENQLWRYEQAIKSSYKGFDKYFIYLTPTNEDASSYVDKDNKKITPKLWLTADYRMVHDSVKQIVDKPNQDMSDEARMILKSYNDLLIKEGIVASSKLEELCQNIWDAKEGENFKYRKALDILFKYRTDNKKEISKIILTCLKKSFPDLDEEAVKKRQNEKNGGHIFRFPTEKVKLLKTEFYLEFSTSGLYLQFDKIPNELEKEFRSTNKLSKSFKEGDWGKYIEDSFDEEKIREHMKSAIEEIQKWESILIEVNKKVVSICF